MLFAKFGSRITMLGMTAGAIAGCLLLASVPIGQQSTFAVLAMLAWTGGLINAVQTTMYALAAHVYPTAIRATGVGTAVAFGRIGGVLAPYAGSWALESGGASRLFALHRRDDDAGVCGAGVGAASHSAQRVDASRHAVGGGTQPGTLNLIIMATDQLVTGIFHRDSVPNSPVT